MQIFPEIAGAKHLILIQRIPIDIICNNKCQSIGFSIPTYAKTHVFCNKCTVHGYRMAASSHECKLDWFRCSYRWKKKKNGREGEIQTDFNCEIEYFSLLSFGRAIQYEQMLSSAVFVMLCYATGEFVHSIWILWRRYSFMGSYSRCWTSYKIQFIRAQAGIIVVLF